MEADWEIEVGGDAPVIEARWAGFVDLRRTPDQAWQLAEVGELPALAEALARLNAPASAVWTSKCDFWPVIEPNEFDPDELDAQPGDGVHAMGCYIDVLPRGEGQWVRPEMAVAACKCLCSLLRAVPLRCCRADLVVRRALIAPERMDLGVTAYLTSCGPSSLEAAQTLQAALREFADAFCPHSTLQ